MFDLEAEWAVGVDDKPILLRGNPAFSAALLSLTSPRYFYAVYGQKQIAAHGFQSDDFPTGENSNAGGDRASSRFRRLPRHEGWIPANV
jgi:hypothetical protein